MELFRLIESFHWMNIKNVQTFTTTITLTRGQIGCKFVITSYPNNNFDGLGLPNIENIENIFDGSRLFLGQNLRDFNTNQANNDTFVVTTHGRPIIALTLDARQ